MAVEVTVSRVASALATLFQDKIIAQMNRSVVLAQLLPHAPALGQNLTWDVEFSNSAESADSSLAEGATVTVFGDDDIVPAVLQWANYSEAISLTGKARAIARASGSPAELEDLFGQKLERAVRRLTKNLARDMYVGPGSSDRILGLFGGASLTTGSPLAATGTYAGIDRSTYATWAGNVLANGGAPRALDVPLMRDMRRTIYEACGEMPDLIVCDAYQHEQYGLTFGSERRYVQDVTLRGQKITLDGGYRALEFDGIPVIADVNCPAGSMVFMNSNYVKFRQLPDSADEVNKSMGVLGLHGTSEEQLKSGATRMFARINPLARVGDAYNFQLILYPQLQVERCNALGLISDLATS